jgi:hypothetical protein
MIAILAGCASIGPKTVSHDRFGYVTSITESWKRQILLNIVKIRYIEPVFFVDVGQIVAGYSLEPGVNLGGKGTPSSFSSSASIEAGVSGKYTDRPTIIYVPMTSNPFVKGLMTPISPVHLLFVIQSGLPPDMILKLGVGSINGHRNDSATIAGYSRAEGKFLRIVELMVSLQQSGAIAIKIVRNKDDQDKAFISFCLKAVSAEISAQVRELQDLLGLDPGADQYRLINGIAPENNREIAMQTLSLMHMLASMAARVEVSEADVTERRASPGIRETAGKSGSEGGFLVRSSDTEPQDAFVSVKYRNHWFWVDDRDLESKRAISFIMLVFTLADTGSDKPLPLVTIPAQ